MSLGTASVQRPVLAIVASLFIVIVGGLAYLGLPISEYPDVVPPTIVVSTTYPGASAQTVADTVATPIEQEVNGVEHMLYMYSQATSNGDLSLTITFKPGTDLDKAQVLVQNRVAVALSRLPEPVQHNSVTTQKSSPTILCAVFLFSPCVIHAMPVHGFTACRSRISRDAGHRFHAMSVHHFTACRSSS